MLAYGLPILILIRRRPNHPSPLSLPFLELGSPFQLVDSLTSLRPFHLLKLVISQQLPSCDVGCGERTLFVLVEECEGSQQEQGVMDTMLEDPDRCLDQLQVADLQTPHLTQRGTRPRDHCILVVQRRPRNATLLVGLVEGHAYLHQHDEDDVEDEEFPQTTK